MMHISFDWAHEALAFVDLCKEHGLTADLGYDPDKIHTNLVRVNDGKTTILHCGNVSHNEFNLAPIVIGLIKLNVK